jgi:molybdate transport system ATP-binding protein
MSMIDGIRAHFKIAYPSFALDVDVTLPGRGITALFGPSGAGKTLFLRVLAGLERAPGAQIEVNGEVWQDASGAFVPTHRRALGYVFQEASLFPHLSVHGNLDYALRRSGAAPSALESTAAMLGISALLERRPDRLSGGERQRVAIARTLLAQPRLLLFDEPLASLDLARRAEILPYLERLHDTLNIPSVYVTHMPDEVARLADHVVLLDHGRVAAAGPLQETLARLDLPAPFNDSAGVVIDTQFGSYDAADRLTRLKFAGRTLYVPHAVEPGTRTLRCRIDARDVSITLAQQADTSILNIIPAVVVGMADGAAQVLVRLDAGGTPLLARITRRSWDTLRLAPGCAVWAQIKAVALIG